MCVTALFWGPIARWGLAPKSAEGQPHSIARSDRRLARRGPEHTIGVADALFISGGLGGFGPIEQTRFYRRWVEIEGERHWLEGDTLHLNGEQHELRNNRIHIGEQSYAVRYARIDRNDRFRLAMDRRIDFSAQGNQPRFGRPGRPLALLTVGDRTRASRRLTDPRWQSNYQRWGQEAGQRILAQEHTAYIEFWNEPYLNWANDNRKNFAPQFFDQECAEEGGAVHIAHDGSMVPHLRWTRNRSVPLWNWTQSLQEWRRGRNARGQVSLSLLLEYRLVPNAAGTAIKSEDWTVIFCHKYAYDVLRWALGTGGVGGDAAARRA